MTRFIISFVGALVSYTHIVPHLQFSWQNAKEYCRARNGDLVSINDGGDLQNMFKAVKFGITSYWIGMKVPSTVKDLFWSDNRPYKSKPRIDFSKFGLCMKAVYPFLRYDFLAYKSCKEKSFFMCKIPGKRYHYNLEENRLKVS